MKKRHTQDHWNHKWLVNFRDSKPQDDLQFNVSLPQKMTFLDSDLRNHGANLIHRLTNFGKEIGRPRNLKIIRSQQLFSLEFHGYSGLKIFGHPCFSRWKWIPSPSAPPFAPARRDRFGRRWGLCFFEVVLVSTLF